MKLHLSEPSRRKPKPQCRNLRRAVTGVAIVVVVSVMYLQYWILNAMDLHHHEVQRSSGAWEDIFRGSMKPTKRRKTYGEGRILSAYLEPLSSIAYTPLDGKKPWFSRNTSSKILQLIEYKELNCERSIPDLPIDNFPSRDPFLPWLHDYFVSEDSRFVRFVAQNKRRCDTGAENKEIMEFWEPQVALFQPIPIVQEGDRYRFATSIEEATHPATRFQCHFFREFTKETITTLSEFSFDYEYVTWRKLGRPMIDRRGGKDTAMFWLSTLLFSCPIPKQWQHLVSQDQFHPPLYLDLIPIRTPTRTDEVLLTLNHTGPEAYGMFKSRLFPLDKAFGAENYLPATHDAGRWANLPICPRPKEEKKQRAEIPNQDNLSKKTRNPSFEFVACTWTSASYSRRGDVVMVNDSTARLREWIIFHLMVGVEHVYVYDNTDMSNSTGPSAVWQVAQEFTNEQVTYHPWTCKICNNNRPAHANPGERSSQYAAEASCRERYGPLAEWMTFLDVDEYLVPMKANSLNSFDWRPILKDMKSKGIPVLQFRSTRARPRVEFMEELRDQATCVDPSGPRLNDKFPNTDTCIGPKMGETFLDVFNCEYIRSPKPSRFDRARKQIYQTSYVLSHFVHYSTVTQDYAETYAEFTLKHPGETYLSRSSGPSWSKRHPDYFVDELATGTLIHARSIMPHETRRRSVECEVGSKFGCMLGYVCDDSVAFADELHKANLFTNPNGSYCNCWENAVVRDVLSSLLQRRLDEHLHIQAQR